MTVGTAPGIKAAIAPAPACWTKSPTSAAIVLQQPPPRLLVASGRLRVSPSLALPPLVEPAKSLSQRRILHQQGPPF
jgi:hypothetical protein